MSIAQLGPRRTMRARYGMKATELVEFASGSLRKATSERNPRTANAAKASRNALVSAGITHAALTMRETAVRASEPTYRLSLEIRIGMKKVPPGRQLPTDRALRGDRLREHPQQDG